MGDVVNLNKARKARARSDAKATAETNRAKSAAPKRRRSATGSRRRAPTSWSMARSWRIEGSPGVTGNQRASIIMVARPAALPPHSSSAVPRKRISARRRATGSRM
ncbi:DUF4169 family protein [Rhizorhabdus histidinilytica]